MSQFKRPGKNSNKIKEDFEPTNIDFPIDIFPEFLQDMIINVSESAGFSKDFLSVSIMSTFASVIGKSVYLKVDNTWYTSLIFWFAIVGETGSKKSHPVKFALKPLSKIDVKNKEIYDEQFLEYQEYSELDEKMKKISQKVSKPEYKQFIISDTTIEALYYVHKNNERGLLIYKDELIGWINGMGQYKAKKSDEMEKFLSLFDGGELKVNRVTKEPIVMESTNINMIGTIQPDVVSSIPKDNGTLHRFLFTNADKEIKRYNKLDANQGYIDNYFNLIFGLDKSASEMSEPVCYTMTSEAKDEFIRIDSFLCEIQEKDSTDNLIKQYCEKLKTYVPRFALLCFMMDSTINDDSSGVIENKHLKMAEKLMLYFLNTAQNLFFSNKESREARQISSFMNGKSTMEKIIELNNKGISKTIIANQCEVSRQYVYKVLSVN